MARGFQVRDPVHNFVQLREKEVHLLDTPLFQRLRGIQQLAMANLVYPGALHTRFDHSLGVCHVAGLLANQLRLSDDEVELVRLAGLLHDLGHGPFSHVSEHALERYADRSKLSPDQKKEKIHELITASLIRNDPGIRGVIGRETCDMIAKLLAKGHGQPALKAIVSGPLDADKQDYLLRDSKFCGVTYGVFDIHQLHRSLVLYGPEDEKELMIDPNGVHAVEQYALAKYYLTTNVYRHRVRLITDQMIVRAITLGIEVDRLKEMRRLYAFDGSDGFVENYATWDDARFMLAFGSASRRKSLCADLLLRLKQRRLLKQVFSKPIRSFPKKHRETLLALGKPEHHKLRRRIEGAVAKILARQTGESVSARFVILHSFDIKSVRATARNDESGILVARDPKPQPFEQESTLFRSINQRYSDAFVEVYAPVSWANRSERNKLRTAVAEPIRESIVAQCDTTP